VENREKTSKKKKGGQEGTPKKPQKEGHLRNLREILKKLLENRERAKRLSISLKRGKSLGETD